MGDKSKKLDIYIEEFKQATAEARHRRKIVYNIGYLLIIAIGVFGTGIASTWNRSDAALTLVLSLAASCIIAIGVFARRFIDALQTSLNRRERAVCKINKEFSDSEPLDIYTELPKLESNRLIPRALSGSNPKYGGPIAQILSANRIWWALMICGVSLFVSSIIFAFL